MNNELPDDTPLADVLLTNRASKVLIWFPKAPIRTVGELRKMSDADLLKLDGCGRTTLLEVRLLTGQAKPGQQPNKIRSDQVLKMLWIKAVRKGACKCDFEQWKAEQEPTR